MADYIKRETAYDTLTEYYHHSTDTQHEALREALRRVPAADVRPVVRGEWVISRTDYSWNSAEFPTHCKCSRCGREVPYQDKDNFCPNCGAKMEVQDDN